MSESIAPGATATTDVPSVQAITVGPFFKGALIIVVVFTAVCFFTNIGLGIFLDTPTESQKDIIDNTGTAWWTGFSAMIGLVIGKTAP